MPLDPLLPPSGIPWYRSQRFTALWQAAALMTLMWVLAGLQSNTWDWKAGLLIPILSNLAVALRDMWSPTVVGPFDTMNKRNL